MSEQHRELFVSRETMELLKLPRGRSGDGGGREEGRERGCLASPVKV